MTRGGIRRLARRGGIKRISDGIYNETRDFVDYFLNEVVKGAAIFAEHAKRKTITAMDVVLALKRNGRGRESRFREGELVEGERLRGRERAEMFFPVFSSKKKSFIF